MNHFHHNTGQTHCNSAQSKITKQSLFITKLNAYSKNTKSIFPILVTTPLKNAPNRVCKKMNRHKKDHCCNNLY